jgi:hypothetical protein
MGRKTNPHRRPYHKINVLEHKDGWNAVIATYTTAP